MRQTTVLTIERDIQEAIIMALPEDGLDALEVIAQLSANMVLSIYEADLDTFIESVKRHYSAYIEAESN